jgi:hypothetical protein
MLKPIEITPINTSRKLLYNCEECAAHGTITLENSIVDVDHEGNPLHPFEAECPNGHILHF